MPRYIEKESERSAKTRRITSLLDAMNDADIARAVQCSREFVRQVRKRTKICSDYRYCRSLTSVDEQGIGKILTYLKKGYTYTRIANIMGLSCGIVNRVVARYGLQTEKHRFSCRKVDVDNLKSLYKQMHGQKKYRDEMAKQLGVSPICGVS